MKALGVLIPAATLVLLVPYFFVSVFSERWWLLRRFGRRAFFRVAITSWLANALTYTGLAVYTIVWFERGVSIFPSAAK
jgi:hypothetical protein